MKRLLPRLLFSFVVAVIAAELVLRVYDPIPFRVAGYRIRLPVNERYVFTNAAATKIDKVVVHTKNSLGFRGPEPPPDFANRLTIVTVGGSTTECLLLSDGKAWPDHVARRLAARRPDVWLNNAGFDGHSTFGHLVLVHDYLAQLHPKLALFLIGINDVERENATTFDAATGIPRGTAAAMTTFAVEHSALVRFTLNLRRAWLAHERHSGHSAVDLRAKRDQHMEPEEVAAIIDQHRRRYVPGFETRVRRLIDECRRAGIDPVLITQPALYGDTIDPATGVDLSQILVGQIGGRGNGHAEWRMLELYNDATRRVAAEQGVYLIDLARAMPKDSTYYYDFVHFTNEGADVVGRIVADQLWPYLERQYTHAG